MTKKQAFFALFIVGIVGFAFLLPSLSPALAQQITENVPAPSGFRITSIGRIISSIFALILAVAGLLAFIFLLLGGIQWITSGGDKGGLESARNRIIHAIIGLIVVFASWAIMLLVQQFLGITIFGTLTIPTAYDDNTPVPTRRPT